MNNGRRMWHLGDILSVALGYVVSPRGARGAEELEVYLAGRPLSLGDQVVYERALRRAVLDQYPAFAAYADDMPLPDELTPEWLRRRVAEFGEYLPVDPLPEDHWVRTRPIWPADLATADPGAPHQLLDRPDGPDREDGTWRV